MAQGKVTDFFSARKRSTASNPSKRRKIEITASEVDTSPFTKSNIDPLKNIVQQPVDTRKENAFSPLQTRAGRKSKGVKLVTARSTTRSRKAVKTDPKQKLIPDILANSPALTCDKGVTQIVEKVTSSWDEHDGPACTPQKTVDTENLTTKGRKRNRGVAAAQKKDDSTPEKRQPELAKSPEDVKARKKLLLKVSSLQKNVASEAVQENVESPKTSLPSTRTSGPKMSAAITKALENCKKQSAKATDSKVAKMSAEEIKKKLSQCGKLEELKSQLSKMNEAKAKLKTPVPKLEQFDKMTVEVEVSSETKPPVPAYEKFHSLATPAAPSLTLPYKYKQLAETFRGMDTVVSMLHNRNEICTFSKLKAAVQTMNKKNFELKHVGQIKTVYPTAYDLRQEKGLPMFGNKTSGYQLTVEANLEEDGKKAQKQKPTFTASHLLTRRSSFHNKLINIVKHHHKEFLSTLSRPLNVPDSKITRWHPKFPLDQVPDVEESSLPEPPLVKTYHSARDVLEDSRGKLTPKIEKALEETAKETEKSGSQPPIKPAEKNKPTSSALRGVPQFLLDKIRAKEAASLASQLTRDPKEDKRLVMMKRLPDFVRIIRSHFITEKKPSLTLDSVIEKLADSYKSCIAAGDIEAHINLTLELVPEWISTVQIKKGKYLKIDRNMDLKDVADKINNIIKTKK